MQLDGQRALVTGASSGIGRAISEAFVAAGIEVFGTSRNPQEVDWPTGVTGLALDVSSPSSSEAGWKAARLDDKEISILVNNAGSGVVGPFAETDFHSWDEQVGLLLRGPMKLCHLALQQWTPKYPGVLVNVSSLAAEYPIPFMTGYNAGKSGLAGLSESLCQELDEQVARVIELRIGDVNTSFNESVRRHGRTPRLEAVWQAMQRHASKAPDPEKVAEALLSALTKDRSGVIRVGSFFQAVVASLFGRLAPAKLKRKANLRYYNIQRSGKDTRA